MPAYKETSITVTDVSRNDAIVPGLPQPFDDMTLAHSLGIRLQTMMYLIIKRRVLYKEHFIPKKSGGTRVLHAPEPGLKYVQKQILNLYLNRIEFPEHVAAYVLDRSTRHSAEMHAGSAILINMDLKDFFPTTRRSWVRYALQGELGYNTQVASLLSDLMSIPREFHYGRRYVVPQGAPTSGAICNLVALQRLDRPLLALCKQHDVVYSRYADDLAFSCKERWDRTKTNAFIHDVRVCIHDSGYRDNRKKLRVARTGRQQRLLGMTINEKPNIIRLHYKRVRARLHHCVHEGFDKVAADMHEPSGEMLKMKLQGLLSYYSGINPEKAHHLWNQYDLAVSIHG